MGVVSKLRSLSIPLLASAILLAACGSETSSSPGSETSSSPGSETSSSPDGAVPGTGLDGPVVRHREPEGTGGHDAAMGGRLVLEGDCLYLGPLEGQGERFPVVWPAGTSWDAESRSVILASGDYVAAGESVSGGGGAGELSSVGAVAGEEAEALVESCVDNTYGEITIFNNYDDAVRKP